MKYELPPLPYAYDALAPHLSAETLEQHYDKHHRGYVDKLNRLIPGTRHENQSLAEVVLSSEGEIFNNAGQAWNHAFFWRCLAPEGGGPPNGKIAELIIRQWGSFPQFREAFTKAATGLFGSGWVWLAETSTGSLEIMPLPDAHTPISCGHRALLVLDVWEHAYYLDYRHERDKYVEGFWNLVDWNFVNANL